MDWPTMIVVTLTAVVAALISLYYKSKYENCLGDILNVKWALAKEQEATNRLQSQLDRMVYVNTILKSEQGVSYSNASKTEIEIGQIMHRAKKGKSQAQIAKELGLSRTAVNTRCKRYSIMTIGKEKSHSVKNAAN